ncbi:unnamed protein product [Psylliodes chrysocephalus]|uniref:Uncharacterized protein n=1 Tax=Psylliodes chrysocephalus TaxID=3402493 RepID=A0A9P0GG03_9CUCU|nr:unnamed protein product [Psylliodes chrysocephala]
MSNALLQLAETYGVKITQKYLAKEHTQMECDSIHACIKTSLKNKDIYLSSDYARITKEAEKKNPYVVKIPDFDFFTNFNHKPLLKYDSIRPGKVTSDPVVTNLRALEYLPKGEINFKINFNDEFQTLPRRPKAIKHQKEKQIQNVNDQREPGETIENDPKENNIKDQHNIGQHENICVPIATKKFDNIQEQLPFIPENLRGFLLSLNQSENE